MLLEHFGLYEEADLVHEAIEKRSNTMWSMDLNPGTRLARMSWRICFEFHFEQRDLLYFNNDNVHIGQSTIV
jgi:3-isopropylmalate dehydrogenase